MANACESVMDDMSFNLRCKRVSRDLPQCQKRIIFSKQEILRQGFRFFPSFDASFCSHRKTYLTRLAVQTFEDKTTASRHNKVLV